MARQPSHDSEHHPLLARELAGDVEVGAVRFTWSRMMCDTSCVRTSSRIAHHTGRKSGWKMPLTIAHIVFDCHDPAKLAAFWAAALGYATNTENPDHAWAYDPAGV